MNWVPNGTKIGHQGYIDTKYQVADIFTKPLGADQFNHLKSYLMGTEVVPDIT